MGRRAERRRGARIRDRVALFDRPAQLDPAHTAELASVLIDVCAFRTPDRPGSIAAGQRAVRLLAGLAGVPNVDAFGDLDGYPARHRSRVAGSTVTLA